MPRKAILALSALLLAGACLGDELKAPATAALRPGVDYELLRTPQPTEAAAGRVEVIEVFQYGCGGCALLEPYLERWAEAAPEHVQLIRVPAVWNALGELHARAFYAADALGVLGSVHAAFFRAIHVDGNRLETEAKLRDFFVGFGVDPQAFDAAFGSFAVHAKVQRAKELVAGRYRIPETPSIVVAGKYLTRGRHAGRYDRWLEIVEALAAQELHAD